MWLGVNLWLATITHPDFSFESFIARVIHFTREHLLSKSKHGSGFHSYFGVKIWLPSKVFFSFIFWFWHLCHHLSQLLFHITHKRYLESLTDIPHVQSMLHGRYIGFIENLSSTKKPHLQILFNLCKQDQSCNTGQNISYLTRVCEMDNLNEMIMNKHLIKNRRINPLLEDEEWNIQMIEEMCLSKLGFNETDIEDNYINTM